MLPSNQTFLYTNLPADDWHNIAWNQPGLQVRYVCPKFWADCPQVKHLPSKHTCTSILKASCLQPLPSTGCSEGFCWHGHLMHELIQCTVFHVEIVQGGMNRSEAEWGGRHELHCVHNASWVFFKKGGGGMTSPQVKAWCNSKRGYMLSLKNWISCLISWTTCANCNISYITVYISCVLTTFLVCQPILSVGHVKPCTVLCCSEVFSIDTQFEKELLVSLHGGVLSTADEK